MAVQMSSTLTGNTPSIITPPVMTPIPPDDPSATPLSDNGATPSAGVGASGAPYVQRKLAAARRATGLHRALLERSAHAAAAADLLAAQLLDLVSLPCSCLRSYIVLGLLKQIECKRMLVSPMCNVQMPARVVAGRQGNQCKYGCTTG